MRVVVVMTTFNRKKLFGQAIESLRASGLPFELIVVDNLSSDGTGEVAKRYRDSGLIDVLLSPVARDRRLYWTQLLGVDFIKSRRDGIPDILLLTGDDYLYKPEWLKVLTEWYADAPSDIALCTLDFEPEWTWNVVTGVVDAGGHRALVRRTAPGANWCLRWVDWLWIEPKYRELVSDLQLDHRICQFMRGVGKQICALGLCVHIGALESLYGAPSYHGAKPLDSSKWGV